MYYLVHDNDSLHLFTLSKREIESLRHDNETGPSAPL